MAKTAKPKVPRGPNAQRRASTRAKIMEAAVRCLAEFGYAATSTPLVARLAKVSRGSLLHQFPTKVDLIIGVAEYASAARGAKVLEELAPYPEGPGRFLHGVDAVWASLHTPAAIALMEVTIAARSDPELAARYPAFAGDLEDRLRRARIRMADNLGVPERLEEIEAVAHLTRMALNGLAMESVFIGRASPDAPRVIALLKALRQRLVDELQNGKPAPVGKVDHKPD
ncbi:MAG: Transcriptional regulator, TetR family protein [Phenylobacterium sp.]|uniref:TetR/AcrR family transcriptional regulator n=1 Tax=Phenylobacterium sp. TaxID=1871053 RepID=UPI00261F64FA|nr:TetR/AcrR family transcriptional regulator [Phenylobacterium sp.]MDB5496214.1 Transcriptional regulator, TetR family protein [Phenylobacterium sp.]